MAYTTAESKVGKYANVKSWNNKSAGLKVGDVIEGVITDVEQFTTKHGEMTTYILTKADGEMAKIIGQTDIRGKMEDVKDHRIDAGKDFIGTQVRITYSGLTETSNGAMKTYNVEYEA